MRPSVISLNSHCQLLQETLGPTQETAEGPSQAHDAPSPSSEDTNTRGKTREGLGWDACPASPCHKEALLRNVLEIPGQHHEGQDAKDQVSGMLSTLCLS